MLREPILNVGEARLLCHVADTTRLAPLWARHQQVQYVERVLLGLGAGAFVLNGACERPDGSRLPFSSWIIDGHERLMALRDFASDEWPVFGKVFYSDLTQREKVDRLWEVLVPHVHLDYLGTRDALEAVRHRLAAPHPTRHRGEVAATGRAA